MSTIKSICVYCGSGSGNDPAYVDAARALGKAMAEQGITLVYGGGAVGLMGAVAYAVLDHGGKVHGIIPKFLMSRERALRGTHELVVTENMHERKQKMFEAADAFVALPGGIGTLEEVVEQMTWAQLGQHRKPILLANIQGFWDPLSSLLLHMRRTEFIRYGLDVEILSADHVADIIPKLQAAAAKVADSDKRMDVTPADKM
jgi:uncharacterized protein (TIGR00730 family)